MRGRKGEEESKGGMERVKTGKVKEKRKIDGEYIKGKLLFFFLRGGVK